MTETIPLAKSAKWPPSATPKLSKSNTEKDAPSWKAFRTSDAMPDRRALTKSIMVSAVKIPDPTTKPTIWLLLREEANRPTARVAHAYIVSPSKPLSNGPISGSPYTNKTSTK